MATGVQDKLNFTVNPLQEAIAYETLMVLKGGSKETARIKGHIKSAYPTIAQQFRL